MITPFLYTQRQSNACINITETNPKMSRLHPHMTTDGKQKQCVSDLSQLRIPSQCMPSAATW